MAKPNYAGMNLDELFAALEVAAINEHAVFVQGGQQRIKLQRAWVAVYDEIGEEIQSRGGEALRRYVPLLAAEHPAVRLAAALGLLRTAPNLAVPALEELSVESTELISRWTPT